MIGITELKNGVVFEEAGQPWLVLEYQHSKMGRGGAVLKTKIKNLITGAIIEKTYRGSEKFDQVFLERKRAQFLYAEEGNSVFMDEGSFEQFTLDKETAGDAVKYIKEGDSIEIASYKGKPISINLPIKVKMKVTEAMEADRGNTATAATKPVKTETGLSVQAPMFIKNGDVIVVDTRTGSYVERAS